MHTQHKELEALFSHTMFPDKNLQKDLAWKLNQPGINDKDLAQELVSQIEEAAAATAITTATKPGSSSP